MLIWQYYIVMESVCSLGSQWRDICHLQFNIYSIALFLCLLLPYPLFASSQYCDPNIGKSHVILGHASLEKSRLNAGTGAEVAIKTEEANFAWLVRNEVAHSQSLSFDTSYTIMDFDLITPMTNGYLHTWGLSLAGSYDQTGADIFYKLTPAISVSSNALKNPELMNSESLQLKTGLIYKKNLYREHTWVLGFMSDYRFGEYRLYPLAGICWQPAQGWLLQLALPDFSIRKTFSNGINLTLYTAPEGNKWHVFSKDMQRNSELSYSTIVSGITAQWSITSSIELSLDFEKQTGREFSIVLDDNNLIKPNAGSGMELTLRGMILF